MGWKVFLVRGIENYLGAVIWSYRKDFSKIYRMLQR